MLKPSVVIFGSSITSARNNGASIFFRGLCRAFTRAGLYTVFVEEDRGTVPDEDVLPEWSVLRYRSLSEVSAVLEAVPPPRLILKFVTYEPAEAALQEAMLSRRRPSDVALFVDGDAPVTLGRIRQLPGHYLKRTLPRFDGLLVLVGGEVAAQEYRELGIARVRWGYCAVDVEFWQPVMPSPELECDLLFVGNRLLDRDSRVEEFFLRAATLCPSRRFLLAGSGWSNAALPPNVEWLGHLSTSELRLAYSSARLVLNVNRTPMARYGYSPASRFFEATACGACMISDRWPGIEEIFAPEQEILLAGSGAEVAALQDITPSRCREIGLAALQRVERDYTCDTWVKHLFETLSIWRIDFARRSSRRKNMPVSDQAGSASGSTGGFHADLL